MKPSLFSLLAASLAAILLAACDPVYETRYNYIPPASQQGRMCANNCVLSRQQCQQSCQMLESNCHTRARLEAENDYLNYVNERQREGKPLKRTRQDFTGSTYCPETEDCATQCEGNHQICHSNCGGQVIPQTVCTANCTP
ncbi:MAG: hypothetical protein EBX37_01245 [Alphaproteobacteria bacterium]|nr:hypothetical protein [Alphaproteobacteria bacterium]